MPPRDHFRPDGIGRDRAAVIGGRPAPLVTVAIMGADGTLLPPRRARRDRRARLAGDAGYYKNPEATAEASAHGWHHTGDIGYLDEDGYLFIVDRAKDMVITGGFNVYSTEVEQALMQHPGGPGLRGGRPARREVGRAGDRGRAAAAAPTGRPAELAAFVKERIGSVKAPKQVEVWADLPRSKVGKVLKTEIRAVLLADDLTVVKESDDTPDDPLDDRRGGRAPVGATSPAGWGV